MSWGRRAFGGFPGPAPWWGAPGGCGVPIAALSDAYEYIVFGPANPFALRWIPAGTILGGTEVGELRSLGRIRPLPAATSAIHPGDSPSGRDNALWHHISIAVDGEAIFPAGTPPPDEGVVRGSGNTATLLKARITLLMGNSRSRVFDLDIGAGVEIDVKCRSVGSIVVLVPDPTSVPPDVPPPFDTGTFELATVLTTTVMCGSCPQGYRMPASYSQAFFVGGVVAAALMPIVPATREVELFSSEPIAAAGSVVGTFIYAVENPIVAAVLPVLPPPPLFAPVGAVAAPVGEPSTRRVIIPGNANAIIVTRGAASDGSVLNVVQLLNV